MSYMTQYVTWSRANFRDVIRREVMDTSSRWFQDSEINQYLDDWLNDINQEFELVWAINTLTIGSTTVGSLCLIPLSTFTPGMLRNEAVYYNSFRLAGRLLQNLEVGDPIWRSDLGIGTNVGQNIAAALAGQTTVKDALEKSQASTTNVMTKAGYIK